MKEQDLIENKELRERCISRIEVLDKVGSLVLLPKKWRKAHSFRSGMDSPNIELCVYTT